MTIHLRKLNDILKSPKNNKIHNIEKEYFINMGPQHPSTHGVLRLILRVEGEIIKEVIPVLGYIHRGIEKIGEHQTYRQFVHLTDRCDYLSAMMNNWAVTRVVESHFQIETNDRIETIRTILSELQRLQSHALWWGVFSMDLGALTAFFYGYRDREILTEILEDTCGSRLTMNFIQPGGLMYDIKKTFPNKVKKYLIYLKTKIDEYEELISKNVIIQKRTENIGILSKKTALSIGATGPVLRASGICHDLRKTEPYGVYDKVNFAIPIGTNGDSWDRYSVRIEEMKESIKIITQLIDDIPAGKHMTMKFASKIKLPSGSYYGHLETARGILGVFIVSDGKEYPYRIHLRSPCFNNLWCITKIAIGLKIADLVAVLSTLDLIIPDIDR